MAKCQHVSWRHLKQWWCGRLQVSTRRWHWRSSSCRDCRGINENGICRCCPINCQLLKNCHGCCQIASEYPPLALEPQPSQERRRWCIFRCRRSAPEVADEDIFGKKWVTLTDAAGNRCAQICNCWLNATRQGPSDFADCDVQWLRVYIRAQYGLAGTQGMQPSQAQLERLFYNAHGPYICQPFVVSSERPVLPQIGATMS